MAKYGLELIIDMSGCNVAKFNRTDIKFYFIQLCKMIDMKPEDLHFWDDYHIPPVRRQTDPKTKGTTAIQFILTSNITVHTLDLLRAVFINVFSCKDYDVDMVKTFTVEFFGASNCSSTIVERCIP